MISVGSSGRDARPELGLGFSGRRSEMDDTELEEGEACFHHHNNDDDFDASTDPDVALSYIDEKLQDVLGHFQKDFEGGVSAENLGAKFGGYGSFLPTHQRSPVWSQRTPPKVQSHSASRSPNNFHLEGGHCNSVVSSTAPPSGGRGPASTSSISLPAVKASSVNESGKQEVSMPAARVEEIAPRLDFKNKKPSSALDQKTLKVRIKVGSDNLSTRKNAAIYSGLGLDDSPSSSLDDSPSESEGISHERQDAPFESPTSILQIMTSFPVQGGLLLSPLHDDFIHLKEKEKLPKEGRYAPIPRGGMETSGLINGSDTMKSDGKMLGEKNLKLVEKTDLSAESKSGSDKDARLRDFSRKEPDLDALACEELVSNTLKLPILSNSYSTAGDMKKSRDVNKSAFKDKVLFNQAEEELMESTFTQEDGWVEKRKNSSTGKGLVEGKESSIDISVHPSKEGQQKGEKIYETLKSDSNVTKAKKALNTESMDPSKQKAKKKVLANEQENTRLPHGKDNPLPWEKKKLKGSHVSASGEVPKESSRVSSSIRNSKKKTSMDISMSNTDPEHGKSQKDLGKSADRYKDFFGELDVEDNPLDLLEIPSEEKHRESDVRAKSISVINGAPKERPSGRKVEKPSMSEAVPLTASSPRPGNGLLSDAAPPAAAPVLIEENWVQCDKCQTWRLLPLGTNPDHLPEKWLCSMLNWLPGMNRCSFTEEETTKALITLYQPAAPESQTNLHTNPGGIFSGATLTNFRHHPDQNPRNLSGKKKHGVKVMSNSTNKDSPSRLSNSTKKSTQASAKSRSLNDVHNSPLVNEPDFQQLSKSIDGTVENKQKYKEKNKLVEPHAFGGDTKNSMMKSRRDSDQDSSRASKKIKTEVKNVTDEDWTSDHSGAIGKAGPSSSSGFPTSSAGKDRAKFSDRSFSKDSKFDLKDKLQVSSLKAKVKDEVSLDNGSLDRGNNETRDTVNKRKTKDYPGTERHLPNSLPFVKEEISDNDYRKEKKPRVSRSEGKESSASKGSSRADKKRSHSKNQLHARDLGISKQNDLDGMESSKRDLGSVQASLAATSSSSKVSGSHKTKSSFQEVKGSPVESVSSSPMRIANPDKFTSANRDVLTKDEFEHLGNFALRSPKRSLDGEDLGRSVAHHGYLESSTLDFQEKDFNHTSSGKTRRQAAPSPDIANHHSMNGALNNSGQDTQYPSKVLASDHFVDEEKQNGCNNHANGSRPRKSSKGSSSRLDKSRSFKSDSDAVQNKSSDVGELHDHSPSDDLKPKDGKQKLHEKLGVKSEEIEEKVSSRKDGTGKMLSENYKRESQLNVGGPDGIDQKVDATCRKDAMLTPKQNILPESNDEKSSKRLVSDKTDQVEAVSSGERSVLLPPSGGSQGDTLIRCSQPGTGSHKGNGSETLQVAASEGDNALKVQKHIRKTDNQNRSQQISSRHPTKNGHRARDVEVPSPLRKDLPSLAATNALKEAKDIKHMADRLKSSGSNHERTGLYFQAALKFLHGASLLESGCSESSNHSDSVRSRQTYSETAKLCEFCAHEYEKAKDMAAAALAYKCMEVAYMRVVYSSHASASRDRNELQRALQVVPLGESPSSSASDVDNLNNHTTADKVALSKGVSSPQIATNHVIAARNRPNFTRLLCFAQDVNFAMEASRKSRNAFAAANVNMAEAKHGEGISSIKRALDFNFQDVDGLLRLVRLAMEAISR